MPEASSKPPKLLYHSIIIAITLLTVLYVGFSPQEPSASADNALEAQAQASVTTTTTTATQQTLFTLPPAAAVEVASSAGAVPSSQPDPRFQALGIPASPTPTPTLESLCEPAASGLYCVYTVRPDDSLSGIALLFGIASSNGLSAAEMLAASNQPDVIDSNTIIPGQKLRLPKSGIIHTIITAETISELAAGYGTTSESITAANPGSSGSLSIGQEVLIPNPSRVPSMTAVAPEPTPTAIPTPETALAASETPTETPEPEATPLVETTVTAEATATATLTPVPPTVTPSRRTPTPRPGTPTATPRPPTGSSRFIWPASGPISSYFGPAHPLGIDIDFFHNPNQPVVASAAGTVSFAGGNTCCSYGLYVVVEHADGFTTLYAHLSQVNVSAGQAVSQGQVVGLGGRTGYATGNHLHFEIRKDGNVTNPLGYLP